MPQLDPAVFSPQLFWLAISFIVLYVVMARIALPRIGRVIEERRDRVADDLDQAEKFKAQTETALAEYEAALAQARAKAQGIAQEMRAELDKETAAQEARLSEQLNAKLEEAEARIAQTKAKALESLDDIATDVTAALVERLSGQKPGADDLQTAVSSARKSS